MGLVLLEKLRYVCPHCKCEADNPGSNLRLKKKCKGCKKLIIIPELVDTNYGKKLSINQLRMSDRKVGNAVNMTNTNKQLYPKYSISNNFKKHDESKGNHYQKKISIYDVSNNLGNSDDEKGYKNSKIKPKVGLFKKRSISDKGEPNNNNRNDTATRSRKDNLYTARRGSRELSVADIISDGNYSSMGKSFGSGKRFVVWMSMFIFLFSISLLWAKHFYKDKVGADQSNMNSYLNHEEVFEKFYKATKPKEICDILRFPEKNGSNVYDFYYSKWKSAKPYIEKKTKPLNYNKNNFDYYYSHASFKDKSKFFLAAVKTNDGYKFDWESFIHEDMKRWTSFLDGEDNLENEYKMVVKIVEKKLSPLKEKDVKIGKSNKNDLAEGLINGGLDMLTLRLKIYTDQKQERKIYTTIDRRSNLGRKITSCFKDDRRINNGALMILKLSNPRKKDNLYLVDIDSFVTEGWVKRNNNNF